MTITLTRGEAQNVLNLLILWLDEQEEPDTETAIETLRAKLSEPEAVAKMQEMLEVQGSDGNWNYDPYMHGMYNGMEYMLSMVESREPVFREAPKKWLSKREPEPEPVAWIWDVYNGGGYSSRGIGFQQTDIPFAKHTPLYTAPPQRDETSAKAAEWQGLTDEERNYLAWESSNGEHCVAMTEAKLKGKNYDKR